MNWPDDLLTVDYETPAYWVVFFDLLLVLYVWVTPLALRKLIVQSTSAGFSATVVFGAVFYFAALVLIRKENLLGCLVFIALYIPLFIFGEGSQRVSAGVFFLITVSLFVLNRKRLKWL